MENQNKKLVFCYACCMDGSDENLVLDENGVCNHCHQTQESLREIEKEKHTLPQIIKQIKKEKNGVIIGLSGGVDSSLALHYLAKNGIKIYAFSMDNGYNLPLADENVLKMVEKLKVPFYRYVINLEKFRELQSAFLRGGIKNLEAITDHVLFAVTYEMAVKNNIKYIISGGNTATESIMPISWGEDARDLYWIKSVYKKITGKKLTGLPMISLWKEQYYRLIKRIKTIRLLDYYEYNRDEAIELLKKEYGYVSYGEKHCENVWTAWFQNFYLFTKYSIDKRKAHYSSLINSGQMTREHARELLAERPVYPELGIEKRVMQYPKRSYQDYPNSEWIRKQVIKIYRFIPKKWKS